MFRLLAVFALLSLAGPALSQTPAPAPTPPAPATVRVLLQTSAGDITIVLETERAPITAGNFLRYVDARRFDGMNFYRTMKLGPEFGVVQAGITNPRLLYPPIAHEPTTQTGLSHVDGALSMARFAPGSARTDFFVSIGAQPGYNADPARAGDNLGFAVFGRVVEGMDVIRRIMNSPTSPTLGEGIMRGQMLDPPVRIITARRVR